MLDKQKVKDKMKERGFVEYASIGKTQIQFVSEHMYDIHYEEKTLPHKRIPIINIIIDLEKDEFKCIYNIEQSVNTLNSASCSSVMNDKHFDHIVAIFESHVKWMERLTQ